MAREAPSRGGQFAEVGWGFCGILICPGVLLMLRWMMLEKVLVVAASWVQPCLVAKSLWGSVGMSWLAPFSNMWSAAVPTRG
jgi:hypothetical protein